MFCTIVCSFLGGIYPYSAQVQGFRNLTNDPPFPKVHRCPLCRITVVTPPPLLLPIPITIQPSSPLFPALSRHLPTRSFIYASQSSTAPDSRETSTTPRYSSSLLEASQVPLQPFLSDGPGMHPPMDHTHLPSPESPHWSPAVYDPVYGDWGFFGVVRASGWMP